MPKVTLFKHDKVGIKLGRSYLALVLYLVGTKYTLLCAVDHLLRQVRVPGPLLRFQHVPTILSRARVGGIPNFQHLQSGKYRLPAAAIPFAHGVRNSLSPTPLPLVSTLNSLSHLDLHILTNLSRVERSICSQPTLWKT